MGQLHTCTGQYLSCMLFAVKRLTTLASFRSRLSSNPNIGAGLTMVVSGKISRTTRSA
jgi:hypothetical protein